MANRADALDTVFGRVVLYDTDETLRTHVHSALHALLPVPGARSAAITTFEDDLFEVSGHHAVFVDPWVPHAFRPENGERVQVLALYVEPTFVRRSGEQGIAVSFKTRRQPLATTDVERIAALAHALRNIEGRRNVEDVRCMFNELATGLLHRHASPRGIGGLPKVAAMDQHVRRAVRWLNDQKGCPFSTEDLVAASGLSRSHLFARFKACVGISPKRYADALRVECAIAALATEAGTVADVAADLGFPSQARFARFVKDLTGMSPSDHRRASRARGEAPIYLNEFA